ncbi:MAG: hypothetical protein KA715_01115 [Xanthomonadaceae bacterium]|nr:hypothetical protein [Xanthomonadaceae bacterium]
MKRSVLVIVVAFVLAKTLSTGSTSFRRTANDEFQVFNEIGRCENDIDQKQNKNYEIISDCVRKHLSTHMDEAQKKKIVSELLGEKSHWSGAFHCKNAVGLANNSVCFNIVHGEKIQPSQALFQREEGTLKIVAIRSEQ